MAALLAADGWPFTMIVNAGTFLGLGARGRRLARPMGRAETIRTGSPRMNEERPPDHDANDRRLCDAAAPDPLPKQRPLDEHLKA